MIRVSKCYQTVTEESAENGECASQGFESEDVPYTFKELCELINGLSCSSMPSTGSISDWVETDPEQDYRTGEYTSYSYHYSRDNLPRTAKYWRLAFAHCGFTKEK